LKQKNQGLILQFYTEHLKANGACHGRGGPWL